LSEIIEHFNKLEKEANIQLEVLEAALINIIEGLTPAPYNSIINNTEHFRGEPTDEQKKLQEFYTNNPSYCKAAPGNYLVAMANRNIPEGGLTYLAKAMLSCEELPDLVNDLNNKYALPWNIKQELVKFINHYIHNYKNSDYTFDKMELVDEDEALNNNDYNNNDYNNDDYNNDDYNNNDYNNDDYNNNDYNNDDYLTDYFNQLAFEKYSEGMHQ
jgi:hypothetical protein